MTKELEQEMIGLENELSEPDSYIRDLQIHLKEQVKSFETELKEKNKKIVDLEYDLFLEKTREPKNKFYWFTAKKTPFVASVTYISNEKVLYGFKEVPKYKFIEKYDLRFITNCSFDEITEQFR